MDNGGVTTTLSEPAAPGTSLLPALRLGPITVDTPVVLAPMAGITNTAFRRLCREYGGGLYVNEMVTARALVERRPESLRIIKHEPDEVPRSVQLYSVDPVTTGHAVRMLVEEDRADHIDLNFGCPVPKVTRKAGDRRCPGRSGSSSPLWPPRCARLEEQHPGDCEDAQGHR